MDKNILKNRVALLLDLEYSEAESIINTFFQRVSDIIANKSTSSFYLNKIGTISTKHSIEQYIETNNKEYKYYPPKLYPDFSENMEVQSLTIRDIKINYAEEGFSLTNKYRKVVAIIKTILDEDQDVYIDNFGIFSKNTKITFTASDYLLYRINPYFNLSQRNITKSEYIEYFYKDLKTDTFLTLKERAKIIEEIIEEHIDTEDSEDKTHDDTNINSKEIVEIIEEVESVSTEEKIDDLVSIKEESDDSKTDDNKIIDESDKDNDGVRVSIKEESDNLKTDDNKIIDESYKDSEYVRVSIEEESDNLKTDDNEIIDESEKNHTFKFEIIETIDEIEDNDDTEKSDIYKVYNLNIDINEVIENDNNIHIIENKEYIIDVEMEDSVTRNKPYTHKINLVEHVEQKPLKKSVIGILDSSLKENDPPPSKKSTLKVFIISLSMIVLVAFTVLFVNKMRMSKEEKVYSDLNKELFDIVNNHFISINNDNDINYIVSENQYFWNMSKDVYKDSLYWPLIFALNQSLLKSTDIIDKGKNINYRVLSEKERNHELDVTLAKSYLSLYKILEKENRPKHARWVVKLAAYFDFDTFKNNKDMIPEDIYNEVLNYKF